MTGVSLAVAISLAPLPSPEQLADRRKRRANQRDRYPAALVGTVIFLAADDSDFLTGQAIGVDGGMNMH